MGANEWLDLSDAEDMDRLLEFTDREIEDAIRAVLTQAERETEPEPTIEEGY